MVGLAGPNIGSGANLFPTASASFLAASCALMALRPAKSAECREPESMPATAWAYEAAELLIIAGRRAARFLPHLGHSPQ